MSMPDITIICFVAFFVSTIGVSVGGSGLIVVPLLIALGMNSQTAIATNMFALIFMSASGAIGFRKDRKGLENKHIVLFSLLTIIGAFIGANLVLSVDDAILKKIIAIIICLIAVSLFFKRDLGIKKVKSVISLPIFLIGSFFVFVLGIYAGFFSGGYITLINYVFILFFGLSFLQTAYITKIFNMFSSIVACAFFYYHGLIDFSIGIPLAVFMSLGAYKGARIASKKGNVWIRNLFFISIIALAIKLLFF
jgi:uncharacterized protein